MKSSSADNRKISENEANPIVPAASDVDPGSSGNTGTVHAPPAPHALFPVNEGRMAQRVIHDLMVRWIDQALTGEPLCLAFLVSLPPTLLFNESCKEAPAIHLALRKLLLSCGVAVRNGHGVVIVQALAGLYEDHEHWSLAKMVLLPSNIIAESESSQLQSFPGTLALPSQPLHQVTT